MRYLISIIFLLSLLMPAGCNRKCNAAEVEYEFLTPGVVVLKCNGKIALKTSSIPILRQGDWQKENALLRDMDGNIKNEADITDYLFLCLGRPLRDREVITISTNRGDLTVQYSADVPSNIFKLNQVGNGGNQSQKYAYAGAWLGSAGSLPLKEFAGREFELRQSSGDTCVYRNTLRLRRDDPVYQYETPFTGEEVLELDYSSFNIPGEYYFYVNGIGRSFDFRIGAGAISEAFYIHARGLYHKRCGIAKSEPFTNWEAPVCHNTVLRGKFPGNAEHYRKGKAEKDHGFF